MEFDLIISVIFLFPMFLLTHSDQNHLDYLRVPHTKQIAYVGPGIIQGTPFSGCFFQQL